MSDDKKKKGLEPAQAVAAAELVGVADGGIVSRELARTSGGTLTVFAFDKGEGLSEHTAPFDAIVHVLTGRLELTIGGAQVEAASGHVVLMPAEVPHALHAPEPAKMMLIMLR